MKKLTPEEILEFVQDKNNQRILNVFKFEKEQEKVKVRLNDIDINLYLSYFQKFVKEKHEENKDLKLPNAAQILSNFAFIVSPRLSDAKLKISDENVLSVPDEDVVEYLNFYQEKFLEPFQKEE